MDGYRDCARCGFTLYLNWFPIVHGEPASVCVDCYSANPVVHRVAALAADQLLRCRAALALLNLGRVRIARIILAGATDWPLPMGEPRMSGRLWWIAFDLDTLALLRMLVQTTDPRRTPLAIPA